MAAANLVTRREQKRGNPNWQKGKSGNPSGRPKVVTEIRELAQQHGPEAFERVLQLVRCDDPRVALTAAQTVLDRAYGKPSQSIEHTGKDGGPIQTEELNALDALRSRILSIATRTGTGEDTGRTH